MLPPPVLSGSSSMTRRWSLLRRRGGRGIDQRKAETIRHGVRCTYARIEGLPENRQSNADQHAENEADDCVLHRLGLNLNGSRRRSHKLHPRRLEASSVSRRWACSVRLVQAESVSPLCLESSAAA